MSVPRNHLEYLPNRVRCGTPDAAGELQRACEENLVPIVRRVLRMRCGQTPLARRVLAELARFSPQLRDHPDLLARHMARRISAAVINDLRPPQTLQSAAFETVRI